MYEVFGSCSPSSCLSYVDPSLPNSRIPLDPSSLRLFVVGPIQLADFGHAGLMPADNTRLYTRDCGTPGYKAPELREDWKHGHGLVVSLEYT